MSKNKTLYAIYKYDFHKAIERTIEAEAANIDGTKNLKMASTNIVGAKVLFYPSRTVDSGTGKQTVALLKGMKVKETAKNDVVKE